MDEFGPDTIELLDAPWDDFDQPCGSSSQQYGPDTVNLLDACWNEGYTHFFNYELYSNYLIAELDRPVPLSFDHLSDDTVSFLNESWNGGFFS
jgi:hypothetical protein